MLMGFGKFSARVLALHYILMDLRNESMPHMDKKDLSKLAHEALVELKEEMDDSVMIEKKIFGS